MNSQFEFADPHFFWLLAALPLAALLRGRSGPAAALLFSSLALTRPQSHPVRRRAGALLLGLRLFALALCVLALARPRISHGLDTIEAPGIDIVLAVDVSLSMLGLDFTVDGRRDTRLEAVKVVLADFIRKRPHDRLGLVAFAGEPYLVSPLTLNHDWLRENLERMRVGLIRESGTAIGSAIAMSVNRLRDLPDAQSRVIILLTDGQNNSGQVTPIAAAEAAASFSTRIYTVLAGTADRVLVPRMGGDYQIIRNSNGEPIPQGYAEFPLDEPTLISVAEKTGGRFFRATDTDRLKAIYEEIDRLEKTTVEVQRHSTYEEWFLWPLGLGLAAFLLEQVLAHTRFRRLP